jgi:hypothetical protein
MCILQHNVEPWQNLEISQSQYTDQVHRRVSLDSFFERTCTCSLNGFKSSTYHLLVCFTFIEANGISTFENCFATLNYSETWSQTPSSVYITVMMSKAHDIYIYIYIYIYKSRLQSILYIYIYLCVPIYASYV